MPAKYGAGVLTAEKKAAPPNTSLAHVSAVADSQCPESAGALSLIMRQLQLFRSRSALCLAGTDLSAAPRESDSSDSEDADT